MKGIGERFELGLEFFVGAVLGEYRLREEDAGGEQDGGRSEHKTEHFGKYTNAMVYVVYPTRDCCVCSYIWFHEKGIGYSRERPGFLIESPVVADDR
jgi:hypothetical protein